MSVAIRQACENLFMRYLKRFEGRPGVFVQTGRIMVLVETRQWKLSYSPMEKARFDVSDPGALLIEVPADDNGVHLIPWNMVLRITVNEGQGNAAAAPEPGAPGIAAGLRFR